MTTLTVAVWSRIPVAGLTYQTKRDIDIRFINGNRMDAFSINTIPVTFVNAQKVAELSLWATRRLDTWPMPSAV